MKTRVLGITSLCSGSPFERIGTNHLFFYDFDNISEELVCEEARRLHEKFGIDIYVLKSSEKSFHLISFDILEYRQVQSVQADIRLESDYPLISERMWDKFLTLRITNKAKKKPPIFVKAFVQTPYSSTGFKKSLQHYLLYQEICKIPPAPKWYEWKNVELYFASYQTSHGIS